MAHSNLNYAWCSNKEGRLEKGMLSAARVLALPIYWSTNESLAAPLAKIFSYVPN
jgi:hypothetical protein